MPKLINSHLQKIVDDLVEDVPSLINSDLHFSKKCKFFDICLQASNHKSYLTGDLHLKIFLNKTYPFLATADIAVVVALINERLKNLGFIRKRTRIELTQEEAFEAGKLGLEGYSGRMYAFHSIKICTNSLHFMVEYITQGLPSIKDLPSINSVLKVNVNKFKLITPFFEVYTCVYDKSATEYYVKLEHLYYLVKIVYPSLTLSQNQQVTSLIEEKLISLGFPKSSIINEDKTQSEFITVFKGIRLLPNSKAFV